MLFGMMVKEATPQKNEHEQNKPKQQQHTGSTETRTTHTTNIHMCLLCVLGLIVFAFCCCFCSLLCFAVCLFVCWVFGVCVCGGCFG